MAGGSSWGASTIRTPDLPTLAGIAEARARLAGAILRTPLIPLNAESGRATIYLKLENLQPIGSFKLRGALNALRRAPPEALARGVYTASAGNMAQGLAWSAHEVGVPCTVVVPERAPQTKLAAIERLGGRIVSVPFDEWWRVLVEHRYPGLEGFFVHPVSDSAVIEGNATIGAEILEDLPEVDTVLIPYGGGGLSTGIASAVRALRPPTKVYACEVETAAPLSASLAAGAPRAIKHTPSFVDGIGGPSVLEEMWPLVSRLLDGALTVSLVETAGAIRTLAERNRVIAEGAGAAPVAAALTGKAGAGRIACVVSGGNLDSAVLAKILSGETP
jgi:threonine dehydratase